MWFPPPGCKASPLPGSPSRPSIPQISHPPPSSSNVYDIVFLGHISLTVVKWLMQQRTFVTVAKSQTVVGGLGLPDPRIFSVMMWGCFVFSLLNPSTPTHPVLSRVCRLLLISVLSSPLQGSWVLQAATKMSGIFFPLSHRRGFWGGWWAQTVTVRREKKRSLLFYGLHSCWQVFFNFFYWEVKGRLNSSLEDII